MKNEYFRPPKLDLDVIFLLRKYFRLSSSHLRVYLNMKKIIITFERSKF